MRLPQDHLPPIADTTIDVDTPLLIDDDPNSHQTCHWPNLLPHLSIYIRMCTSMLAYYLFTQPYSTQSPLSSPLCLNELTTIQEFIASPLLWCFANVLMYLTLKQKRSTRENWTDTLLLKVGAIFLLIYLTSTFILYSTRSCPPPITKNHTTSLNKLSKIGNTGIAYAANGIYYAGSNLFALFQSTHTTHNPNCITMGIPLWYNLLVIMLTLGINACLRTGGAPMTNSRSMKIALVAIEALRQCYLTNKFYKKSQGLMTAQGVPVNDLDAPPIPIVVL
jgi:hypothetical protein